MAEEPREKEDLPALDVPPVSEIKTPSRHPPTKLSPQPPVVPKNGILHQSAKDGDKECRKGSRDNKGANQPSCPNGILQPLAKEGD